MWIAMSDSFISVVACEGSRMLKVRARKKAHLKKLFPKARIHQSSNTDYAFRIFITRKRFAKLIANRIESIEYPNFKNSVKDKRLHTLYEDFWHLHWEYQNYPLGRKPRAFLFDYSAPQPPISAEESAYLTYGGYYDERPSDTD